MSKDIIHIILILVVVLAIFIAFVATWAILTKIGYIENYLGLKILCPTDDPYCPYICPKYDHSCQPL